MKHYLIDLGDLDGTPETTLKLFNNYRNLVINEIIEAIKSMSDGYDQDVVELIESFKISA